ncbi:cleavage stimulation factor subunit 3-like [Limulus polyphemus]|uniref:Cleavage stimulation factor subunit 3-like n=1 Tax=Limulus polyphemus TaxID=6850 RepID=A0ABM1TLR7_LIMPO|nr:cleavage stimulation factor subunit 3-like [Limulus polyphemus]
MEDTSHHGYIPDRVKKAEKHLEDNQYDVDAWSVLIRDVQNKKIEEARELYEKLVSQFPNAGRYWKLYIENEMKAKNFERVEKLFQRCLIKVLNIDLWRCYLNYVKETKGSLPSYREKMAQAYDFALDKMGMDILSYPIWNDYITFLKSVEAVGSYAENQRITAVRKVYQRGIVNPMINIEQLWKDYIAYEQSINPIIAEKMTADRSRDYMNARRVAKEYEAVTRGLNRNAPSVPPQGTPEEVKQVDLWKKYIAWEKSNPLRTEDHATITKRVMFAYEQCFLCLGHHPDMWYESALFLEQSSKLLTEKGDLNAGKMFSDEAAAIYERAITTLLKTNQLLYFAYADFEEVRTQDNNTRVLFERVLTSGSLTSEKSVEIWNRFLEFESNIGDLASILKVEKRRASVIEKLKEFEEKETALLVDRYKFLDLLPCTYSELKAIGYRELAKQHAVNLPTSNSSVRENLQEEEEEADAKPNYPRPDTNQMIPFKPRQIIPTGAHPVPGGIFPPPPAASVLMTYLPPPSCFHGPFVAVEELMTLFKNCSIPDEPFKNLQNDISKEGIKLFEHVLSIGANNLSGEGGKKRKNLGDPNAEESDEEDSSLAPPVKDIYRSRQQKRVKENSTIG